MKKRCIFLSLLLYLQLCATAVSVSGIVVDGFTKKPIRGAQVFVNKTSVFCLSDSLGAYQLNNISDSVFELVVSATGFQTTPYRASASKPMLNLRFEIQPLPAQAPNADTVNAEQEQLFLSTFFGHSENRYETYITNPEVLRYKYNVTKGELMVTATAMLHIINDGLGYLVNYQLESFSMVASSNIITTQGYYFFKTLNTKNPALKEKWEERRRNAYTGSLLHFMQAFYQNKLAGEGFEIRAVRRVLEDEDDFKTAAKSKNLVKSGTTGVNNIPKKFVDIANDNLLARSDFRKVDNTTQRPLFTSDRPLFVQFTRLRPLSFMPGSNPDDPPRSALSILYVLSAGVEVFRNGSYLEADDLYIEGYMREMVSGLLPLDYVP